MSDSVAFFLAADTAASRKQRVVAAPSPEVRRHRAMHVNVKKKWKERTDVRALTYSQPWQQTDQ